MNTRRCPRIYAHGTNLLLRFAGIPEIGARVGLNPEQLTDPDGSIPLLSHYDLVEAAVEESRDPLLGLHFGAVDMGEARPGAGAIGMLYFASPSLRVSIEKLVEHQGSWNPGERYDISEQGDDFFLRYRCWGPHRPAHDQQAMRNAAGTIAVRHLVEGDLELRTVRLEMARPDGADEIEAVLGCPVEYEAGINEFVIPRGQMDAPLPGSDADLFRYCEGVLKERQSQSLEAPSYTVLVRGEMDKADLGKADALAQAVPRKLGCSPRTLKRRLSEEGTSMRQLIDEGRRERALALLRSDMSLAQVADTLGYAETASFRRAFQRWYRHSPSSWRQTFGATA